MSLSLEILLQKGYLPQELPPPFASQTLGKFVAGLQGGILPFDTAAHRTSRPAIYNLARSGTLRRELSIPNPVHFSVFADYTVKNWTALELKSTSSPFSLSVPITGDLERAIGRKHPLGARPARRAEIYAKGRYLIRADISRFYPSIYTHSIPWALHGKATSKQNKRAKNLGNEMDSLLRNCQDGQTNGIPIGPDTSLLIAELLLSQVDAELQTKGVVGLRYVDDYELVFDSEPEALKGLSSLQQALLDFELNLNPSKTRILPLPLRVDESWVEQLKSVRLNSQARSFTAQLMHFFNTAFDLSIAHPDAGVLKYAAGRIAKMRKWQASYPIVEDLLVQCARVEAGSLPIVLNTILRMPSANSSATERRRNLFLKIILEHAPQRHSSEVAWALWACIALKYQIPAEVLRVVIGMEDSVCAVLALHARALSLVEAPAELDQLSVALTADDLYDPRWMHVYEALCKGWLAVPAGGDVVSNDLNFSKLKAAGVTFYDDTKISLPALPVSVRPTLTEFDEEELLEKWRQEDEGESDYNL